MVQESNLTKGQNCRFSLIKSMLIGSVIGLALISLFLFGVNNPNPAWGKYWMIQPLVFTPLAGAMGGLFYYFMKRLSMRGFNKTLAVIISIIGFIVALWIGFVLGLNGTLWN